MYCRIVKTEHRPLDRCQKKQQKNTNGWQDFWQLCRHLESKNHQHKHRKITTSTTTHHTYTETEEDLLSADAKSVSVMLSP